MIHVLGQHLSIDDALKLGAFVVTFIGALASLAKNVQLGKVSLKDEARQALKDLTMDRLLAIIQEAAAFHSMSDEQKRAEVAGKLKAAFVAINARSDRDIKYSDRTINLLIEFGYSAFKPEKKTP